MADRKIAEPGLFMSDATRAAIDARTIESLEKAHPEGRHTFIFGPDDFTPDGMPTPELTRQFNKVGFDPSLTMGGNMPKGMTYGEGMSYYAGKSGALPANILTPRMEEFAQNACMLTVPMEGGEIALDGALYSFGNPRDFAALNHGINHEWLTDERIPGQDNDFQTWIAHHESDHCGNVNGTHYEYTSDAYANQQYARDLLAGRVQDPEVPYFARSQRAAAQLLGMETSTYAATPLSALAGETPLSDAQLDIASREVKTARDRIYDSIEARTGMDMDDIPDDQDQRVSRIRTIYTESKLMTAQGALDDLPYGKTATERFIDGAERYGHALYDVLPEDRIHTAPDLAGQGMDIDPAIQPRLTIGLGAAMP